jgi:formylglycine-generating enzyme required for sulfatase activity
VSCGDGESGSTPTEPLDQTPATVEVEPSNPTLDALGATVALSATVRDASGQVISGAPVSWSSSDPDVATVSSSGQVVANANGSASIVATSGTASGTAALTVAQVAASAELSADTLALLEGARGSAAVEITDAQGNALQSPEVSGTWTVSDPSVVEIEGGEGSQRQLRALRAAETTVIVRAGSVADTLWVVVTAPPVQGDAEVEVAGTIAVPSNVTASELQVLSTTAGGMPVSDDGSFAISATAATRSTLLVMNGDDPFALIGVDPVAAEAAGASPALGGAGSPVSVDARSTAVEYVMLTPLLATAPPGLQAEVRSIVEATAELDGLTAAIEGMWASEGRLPLEDDAAFIAAYQSVLRATRDEIETRARAAAPPPRFAAETRLQENGIRLLMDPHEISSPYEIEVQNTRSRDVDLYFVPATGLGEPQIDMSDFGGYAQAAEDRAMILRPADYVPNVTNLSFWWDAVTGDLDLGPTEPAPLTIPFTRAQPRLLVYGYGPSFRFPSPPLTQGERDRLLRPTVRTVALSMLLPALEALIGFESGLGGLSGSATVEVELALSTLAVVLGGSGCAFESGNTTEGLQCTLKAVVDEGGPELLALVAKVALNRAGKATAASAVTKALPWVKIAGAVLTAADAAATATAIGISDARQVFDLSYNDLLDAKRISISAGDGQEGVGGTALAEPVTVHVRDSVGSGLQVEGAWVDWRVVDGGGSVSQTTTTTDGSGNASVTWTLGPAGTNQRLVAKIAGHDDRMVVFTATSVEALPPSITTTTLPGATVNAAYSATLSAKGGDGSYAWSLASGSLPSGLALSGAGQISGTPTSPGTSEFTIRVESGGQSSTADLSIIVSSGSGTLGTGFALDQFSLIPAGTFEMGDITGNGQSDERPVHTVNITQAFYLQKTEVTQAQWREVMGENPSRFSGCDDCPVEQVSWDQAQQFISRLNGMDPDAGFRLPTEAEWEYAARAGTTGDYGGTGNLDDMGWYSANSDGRTHPVAEKQANAWGLYDMHGNVWEWVQDLYSSSYYSVSPVDDPPGPASGSVRVLRGGSWNNFATSARSTNRLRNNPDNRIDINGFRLARTR